jgi:PTS system nitrogen regulatory IIA component
MVKLFINSENICFLDATDKFEAIKELTCRASTFKSIKNIDQFQKGVFRRELEMSTGIGKGIAVAHGECRDGEGIKIALGVSKEGINFNAIDNEPVHIMFLVANPPGTWTEYLNILASIVRLVRNEVLCKNLLDQYNPVMLHKFLREAFSAG